MLPPVKQLLSDLIDASLLLAEDWDGLPPGAVAEVLRQDDPEEAVRLLVGHGLLTRFQADRINARRMFGLALGNYRVLERLATGGMGTVYLAEHVRLRRRAAVKVLVVPHDQHPRLLLRFFAEMRAVAQLQHPNIVAAIDAGQEIDPTDPDAPELHYLVMEYVPGQDLQTFVQAHGALPVGRACDLVCQVAGALEEADKHHLIHRDIKPSNIMVTPEGQAKLLDFGLVHHYRSGLTVPQTTMGTVDFMSPEQARDAGTVDIRADLYSLGGTLYWCLTGALPFPSQARVTHELVRRQTQEPPSARAARPDLPAELDAIVRRMMAIDPADRYPNPSAVVRVLLPFCQPSAAGLRGTPSQRLGVTKPSGEGAWSRRIYRVLIVDDEKEVREVCRFALQTEGIVCDDAGDGAAALAAITSKAYDLVLLDMHMRELSGLEVLRRVRANPPAANLKITMFSGRATSDEMAQTLDAGADDYLSKPFSLVQLRARVKAALRLKDAQDRSDVLQRQLLQANAQLEQNLTARDSDFVHACNALLLALAELIERRGIEPGGHLARMQRYSRVLADEAGRSPTFSSQIDENFARMVECWAPLHDIGKVGLPDDILGNPGPLSPEDRAVLESHTTLGAETLEKLAKRHGQALRFLRVAIDLVRHHHERYDGRGYPDRLTGDAIPLAARIVAVADAYDSLRSRGPRRPPLSHTAALQVLDETAEGHLDPVLMEAFRRCASEFERIFRETPD